MRFHRLSSDSGVDKDREAAANGTLTPSRGAEGETASVLLAIRV